MTETKLLINVLKRGHSIFVIGTCEHLKISTAQELADTQFGLKC
jgi:hypothetical protein